MELEFLIVPLGPTLDIHRKDIVIGLEDSDKYGLDGLIGLDWIDGSAP